MRDGGSTPRLADHRGGTRALESRRQLGLLWRMKRISRRSICSSSDSGGCRFPDWSFMVFVAVEGPGGKGGISSGDIASPCPTASTPIRAPASARDLAADSNTPRRVPASDGRSRRDADVEVAGAMRPVGLGGELVEGRRVDGVPALLRALDVSVFPASLAEEVAFRSLAVRAAPAAAFGDKCRASFAATGRPAVEARLAASRPLAVGLEGAFPLAARLGTRLGFLAQDGLWHETRWQLAAPLSDEGLKFHVVLRFRVVTRCASILNARYARAGRSPRGSEVGASAENRPG